MVMNATGFPSVVSPQMAGGGAPPMAGPPPMGPPPGAMRPPMAPPMAGPPPGPPPMPAPGGPPGPQGALGQASPAGGVQGMIQAIHGAAAKMDAIGAQLRQVPGVDIATLQKGIDATKVGIQLIVSSLLHGAINSPQHGPAIARQISQLQQQHGPG